jgi:hypothetical protein
MNQIKHLEPRQGVNNFSNEILARRLDGFIRTSKEMHTDTYDYSKVRWLNNTTKVEIVCKIHGSFMQKPEVHKRGKGCQLCGEINRSNSMRNTYRNRKEDFSNVEVPVGAKLIPLSKGKYALIDEEDFDLINRFSWSTNVASHTCYAYAHIGKEGRWSMPRLLLGIEDSKVLVDHIDHNGLNNRRSNLRVCTHAENGRNKKKSINRSSEYKGVSRAVIHKKWTAAIKFNDKTKHIGCFELEIDAAKAYDAKAVELFGEFACLNFKQ